MALIECISDSVNSYLESLIEKNKKKSSRYFLFGAGIMGMQVAAKLEKNSITDFYYLDNSKDKTGKEIDGHMIMSPEEMKEIYKEGDVIIITVQNNHDLIAQLQEDGFSFGKDFFALPNDDSELVIKAIEDKTPSEILFLGDCSLKVVSVNEEKAQSLEKMIVHNGARRVKTICYNSLYAKSYYYILKKYSECQELPRKVVLWIDLESLNHRYGMYSKVQNYELITEIMDKYPGTDGYDLIYRNEMEERLKSGVRDISSPDRTQTDASHRNVSQRNHFKLNYLYKYKDENETEKYIDKIVKLSIEAKSELSIVLAPINLEGALEVLDKDSLQNLYDTINIFKTNWENKAKVVDLTDILTKEDFIAHFSLNEGIRESGRKKVFEALKVL